MLKSQEHYDLMAAFERTHRGRMDKEPKESWSRGIIYQDGHVNEMFLAYRHGYAYAKARIEADRNVAYGDGFNEGSKYGFRDGYTDALADVRLELERVIDTTVQQLEKRLACANARGVGQGETACASK